MKTRIILEASDIKRILLSHVNRTHDVPPGHEVVLEEGNYTWFAYIEIAPTPPKPDVVVDAGYTEEEPVL